MSARTVGAASPESEEFWRATRERRLVLQWCTGCETPVQYPRSFCPRCQGATPTGRPAPLEWREASGRGVVHAVAVEHKPEAMGEAEPYAVALVDLAEGARLMTNVVGCDPGDVSIGAAVHVVWEALEDGRHLPLFEVEASRAV